MENHIFEDFSYSVNVMNNRHCTGLKGSQDKAFP
jgi:hypothetical protein